MNMNALESQVSAAMRDYVTVLGVLSNSMGEAVGLQVSSAVAQIATQLTRIECGSADDGECQDTTSR